MGGGRRRGQPIRGHARLPENVQASHPDGCRCVPDVAFVADPNTGVLVYDSNYDPYATGWWVVGGTSVSAQSWAALIALANQLRAAAGLPALTDGHQALYNLASSAAKYQKCYRDITMGYNGDFQALTGYDLITGLGCPKAGGLIPALRARSIDGWRRSGFRIQDFRNKIRLLPSAYRENP